MKYLAIMLMAWASFFGSACAQQTAELSGEAVCRDLSVIAYWSATSHLSKLDANEAKTAVYDAKSKNKLRGPIPGHLVKYAEFIGGTSHGMHGPGHANMHTARGDGILSAIYVMELCRTGQMDRRASEFVKRP